VTVDGEHIIVVLCRTNDCSPIFVCGWEGLDVLVVGDVNALMSTIPTSSNARHNDDSIVLNIVAVWIEGIVITVDGYV
jgi:hypothetical protein